MAVVTTALHLNPPQIGAAFVAQRASPEAGSAGLGLPVSQMGPQEQLSSHVKQAHAREVSLRGVMAIFRQPGSHKLRMPCFPQVYKCSE
eukprot:4411916-Amphidinium_carterae.1